MALVDVRKIAVEVAGTVLCELAIAKELIITAPDEILAIVHGLVKAVLIGAGSRGLGAVKNGAVAGQSVEVGTEIIARETFPNSLIRAHPPS